MVYKIIGVLEICAGLWFIFRVATHTATTQDLVTFAFITFFFCIMLARYNERTKEARSQAIRDNAKLKYNKRKMQEMRARLEEEKANIDENGEDEYTTHPVNVQDFARKLYNGEVSLEDLPDTRSTAAIEAAEEEKEIRENEETK